MAWGNRLRLAGCCVNLMNQKNVRIARLCDWKGSDSPCSSHPIRSSSALPCPSLTSSEADGNGLHGAHRATIASSGGEQEGLLATPSPLSLTSSKKKKNQKGLAAVLVLLRPSNEHILIVRVPGAQNRHSCQSFRCSFPSSPPPSK